MKQLPNRIIPAINQTQFKCDFCKKVLVSEKRMARHESYCYFNPNRDCGELGCSNTGKDKNGLECSACAIAKECGGKSYL